MKLPIPESLSKNNQPPPASNTIHQTVSPYDSPPPLATQTFKTPPIKDKPITVSTRKFSFSKILGVLLVVAIILVLVVVGYLFYQNFTLKQAKVEKANTPTIIPTSSAPTPNQTLNWINYKTESLPMEFRLPPGWDLKESENPELGNQKTINVYSPDFSYGDTGINTGYQFLVGPYSELATKYNTFDEFSAQENAARSTKTTTINDRQWLTYPTSAKTLYQGVPLSVAIYSNDNDKTQAEYLFNLILPSIKLTDVVDNTTE